LGNVEAQKIAKEEDLSLRRRILSIRKSPMLFSKGMFIDKPSLSIRSLKTLNTKEARLGEIRLHTQSSAKMFSWIRNLLFKWGLWNKNARILFLGLDNAGKTTLLHVLKTGQVQTSNPTVHPCSEQLQVENVTFLAFDLGGHMQARRLWKDYYPTVDAIVYLIDVADRERFQESKAELDALLMIEELLDTPVLILGNKIDAFGAISEEQLRYEFNLFATTGKDRKGRSSQRPMETFMCSVLYKQGFGDGFKWLTNFL
jgi:GTP-binding protein SAR1